MRTTYHCQLWGWIGDWPGARTVWIQWGLAALLIGQAYASEGTPRLVVGAMHAPPFVMHADDGHWSGLSIELLRQVAERLGFEVEWREYDYDLDGLFHAVENRHLDVAIA